MWRYISESSVFIEGGEEVVKRTLYLRCCFNAFDCDFDCAAAGEFMLARENIKSTDRVPNTIQLKLPDHIRRHCTAAFREVR